jgi:hypothetical protein
MFEALAVNMTNEMRINGRFMETRTDATAETTVLGKMHVLVPMYRASWDWIIFHCVILLGAITFCLRTIGHSVLSLLEGKPALAVWKSSSLPVLDRGFLTQGVPDGAATPGEMETRARNKEVHMPPGDGQMISRRVSRMAKVEDTVHDVPKERSSWEGDEDGTNLIKASSTGETGEVFL